MLRHSLEMVLGLVRRKDQQGGLTCITRKAQRQPNLAILVAPDLVRGKSVGANGLADHHPPIVADEEKLGKPDESHTRRFRAGGDGSDLIQFTWPSSSMSSTSPLLPSLCTPIKGDNRMILTCDAHRVLSMSLT